MASAAAEERMEEEAKGECEIEREEGIRMPYTRYNLLRVAWFLFSVCLEPFY